MKHLFLNKDLSLLAKEKGFDEKVLALWNNNKLVFNPNKNSSKDYIPAPLYSQIIEWFMKKHSIKIWWIPTSFNDNRLMVKAKKDGGNEMIYNDWHDNDMLHEGYDNAIRESFKLI
jgi:hypothetical protein